VRKTIFIFLGLLLAVSMVAFPSDRTRAETVSSPQLVSFSPTAIQPGEKELIDEIFKELNSARRSTKDKDIINQIGIIKDWVKKVQALEEQGDTKSALEVKKLIAERLEGLINQLPMVTPTVTAATAAPSANPLYDELVRIRAKIDKLIEFEEREIPTEKPPPPPEIERPPEMEKLIVYSAKFLCGPAFGEEGVQPGSYSTAINVHNPYNETIYLFKKAVVALSEDEPRGSISSFRKVVLGPDEAIEIDCIDIKSLLGPAEEETTPTATSQQTPTMLQTSAASIMETSQLISFIKGFAVIYATAPLDVVGVYTASTSAGFSLDVEYIPQSTVGVRPIPIPEEEAKCPQGCYCMTKDEVVGKFGTNVTQCQDEPCGYADTAKQIPMFCWKPTEEAKCPQGCDCMTKDVAIAKLGPNATQCQNEPCDKDASGNLMYCWKPAEEAKCPQDCYCMTKDEALGKLGPDATLCQNEPCEYDAQGRPYRYCWKSAPTEEVTCPSGCYCMTEAEARYKPYTWCQGKATKCGEDEQGNYKYCFQETCQPPCECLTPEEAKTRGYEECKTQPRTVCVEDEKGNAVKWYYQKPAITEVKPTPGRILIDPTQARNPVGTQHTITIVVYDTNGKPMANARVKISHTGANSFTPIELTTDGNGKTSYYYTGKNTGTDTIVATVDSLSAKATKEWYTVVKPAKIDLSPSVGRNAPGTRHTVTATIWSTDGKPMPGVVVTFTVSGTNRASGSATTDGNGKASFSYGSKTEGKDTITATADGLKATATKYWEVLK
jgi:hypothetical protein